MAGGLDRLNRRRILTLIALKDIVLFCLAKGRPMPPDLTEAINHLAEIIRGDPARFVALEARVLAEADRCLASMNGGGRLRNGSPRQSTG